MRKHFSKVFLVIIGIITLVLTNALFLIAAGDYEVIVIGGQPVSHYNTGGNVYMPTTYVVDSAEMRGAWVTTVWNEDMPKQTDATEKSIKAYQDTYLEILDTLEKYNMNTIFFQIRPANDAFYVVQFYVAVLEPESDRAARRLIDGVVAPSVAEAEYVVATAAVH